MFLLSQIIDFSFTDCLSHACYESGSVWGTGDTEVTKKENVPAIMELHAGGKEEKESGNVNNKIENDEWLNTMKKYNKAMVCRLTGAERTI